MNLWDFRTITIALAIVGIAIALVNTTGKDHLQKRSWIWRIVIYAANSSLWVAVGWYACWWFAPNRIRDLQAPADAAQKTEKTKPEDIEIVHKPPPPKPPLAHRAELPANRAEPAATDSDDQTPRAGPSGTPLTPWEIFDAIDEAIPLQKSLITKQYAGSRVSFDCELSHGDSTYISVTMIRRIKHPPNPSGAPPAPEPPQFQNVHVPIELPRDNFLLHAKEGAKLHVTGTVIDIDPGTIFIKDATIGRVDHD